ncbi:type II toxin-antitoxin system RelE/ParE family toxin [Rhodopseudomonas sp. HC1]|uniref:type II toxin-antitoxin system RelE/ParE family toxin n=1 Tax=Rhodopseudomonas infernalis TaxID=2897386 RepID=UPI001EE8A4D2|nr:type II toxin-antitoxin system RelE/ParE family toxin [Rhodopseudomonas infernalis]MCG6203070.1 type II toxin-antitoxin system RelE/ParE family toxin [Rhodopseudomonas infernalis]
MRIFKTKEFGKFARKARLPDTELLAAAIHVMAGRWDADLGGGVFKQRIARRGAGKSGGFRVILVCKVGERSFFVHGFAKSEKANITSAELSALRKLATVLTALDATALDAAIAAGELAEISNENG